MFTDVGVTNIKMSSRFFVRFNNLKPNFISTGFRNGITKFCDWQVAERLFLYDIACEDTGSCEHPTATFFLCCKVCNCVYLLAYKLCFK
jgi:hypothetical protein